MLTSSRNQIDQIVEALTNSPARPEGIKHLIFSRINSDPSSTASSSSSRRPTQAQSGCCSESAAGSRSGSCCQAKQPWDNDNGKGKQKACDCAGTTAGVDGEVQQPGLVNQGGIQIDVTAHTKPDSDAQARTADNSEEPEEHEQGSFSSLRSFDFPDGVGMKDCTIFYIGEESRGVINLMMENSGNKVRASNHSVCTEESSLTESPTRIVQVYQYDPSSGSAIPLHTRTPRLLQKRLLALHRMYQTTTIGILVHNVGLRSSHSLVKDLRKLIREKGRKSYTISVGRVRPEKLANFEAIGGWVLVGCKEGGLIDGKEYWRPIVTPHELRLALQGEMESWKPEDWTLDLESVLRGESSLAPLDRNVWNLGSYNITFCVI